MLILRLCGSKKLGKKAQNDPTKGQTMVSTTVQDDPAK